MQILESITTHACDSPARKQRMRVVQRTLNTHALRLVYIQRRARTYVVILSKMAGVP
ncbi:MAG: hypothetical protein ACRCVN_07095 [Spirochaetia bacterium]